MVASVRPGRVQIAAGSRPDRGQVVASGNIFDICATWVCVFHNILNTYPHHAGGIVGSCLEYYEKDPMFQKSPKYTNVSGFGISNIHIYIYIYISQYFQDILRDARWQKTSA